MSGSKSDNPETAVNSGDAFLLDGAPVSPGTAHRLIKEMAFADLWDEAEVESFWSRLVDRTEDYAERLECAEVVTRVTHDRLEIVIAEPS